MTPKRSASAPAIGRPTPHHRVCRAHPTPHPARPRARRPPHRALTHTAFLIALGKPEELELHVEAALRNGVTQDEILEILMQAAVYCGFPAALRGTRIARQALERWEGGEGAKSKPKKSKGRR